MSVVLSLTRQNVNGPVRSAGLGSVARPQISSRPPQRSHAGKGRSPQEARTGVFGTAGDPSPAAGKTHGRQPCGPWRYPARYPAEVFGRFPSKLEHIA
jgi:hypothetical protein